MFLHGEWFPEPDGVHQALFQLVQKIRCVTIWLEVPVDHEAVKVYRAMTCSRCTDDACDTGPYNLRSATNR